MVHVKRHIAKTISYRMFGSFFTIILTYYLTDDFIVSSSIGLGEMLVKPLLYFIHERIWYKWIGFGIKEEKS
jgi:uncharacterized membrane protein